MKKIFVIFLSALCFSAFGATLNPIQLLNPTGSSSGQAIVSTGASSAPAWGGVGLNGIASIAANTVLANATGSSASPTAFAMPSCTTALEWVSGTGFTCNSAGAFTTLSTSGLLSANNGIAVIGGTAVSQTAGIIGTTTNNNANAGSWGEYLTGTTTGTSLTTGTTTNCSSVSLTAGDWDVEGVVTFVPAAGTTVTAIQAGINTVSATIPANNTGGYNLLFATLTTGSSQSYASPIVRVSLASSGTAYLLGVSNFGVSTMTCNGFIRARRVR